MSGQHTQVASFIQSLRKTCGRTTGHGDSCVPGWECGACTEKAEAADLIESRQKDLTAARALLQKLIDIEGPQPGTAAWADEVRAFLKGSA